MSTELLLLVLAGASILLLLANGLVTRRSERGPDATVLDLTSFESKRDPVVDLSRAEVWHIGGAHPSLDSERDQSELNGWLSEQSGPLLTVLDGGGESDHDDVVRPLKVVAADPHQYFELINLMDWVEERGEPVE